MVTDLVDDDMGDQRLEADPGLDPFVEQGQAIEMDHRRQLARGPARPLAHRAAAVEAAQIVGVVDVERLEHVVVGEIVDPQHHIGKMPPELPGKPSDRRLGQPLDRGGVRRIGLTRSHHCAT